MTPRAAGLPVGRSGGDTSCTGPPIAQNPEELAYDLDLDLRPGAKLGHIPRVMCWRCQFFLHLGPISVGKGAGSLPYNIECLGNSDHFLKVFV